jgi:dienelactone hydrolase
MLTKEILTTIRLKVFACSILFGFGLKMDAQTNIQSLVETINKTTDAKLNLKEYVWSQSAGSSYSKPALDYDAIDNYEHLDFYLSISPNGKYFSYSKYSGTFDGTPSSKKNQSLIVESTTDSWNKSLLTANTGFFSADSKLYVFKQEDSLCFLQVGTDEVHTIKQVSSYKQSTKELTEWIAYQLKNNESSIVLKNLLSDKEKNINNVSSYSFDDSGKWLACQLKTEGKELIITNLNSGTETQLPFVNNYTFSNNGEGLVIETSAKRDRGNKIEIQYISLPDGKINTVWATTEKDVSVSNFDLDSSGKKLVFIAEKKSGQVSVNAIWYYKAGMEKAVLKVNNETAGIENGVTVQGPVSFTDNGSYIQFTLQPIRDFRTPRKDAVQLDIWNHKDLFLQSTQLLQTASGKSHQVVINPEGGKVIQIERENETEYQLNGDFAIVQKFKAQSSDRFWEPDKKDSSWLISLKDGSRLLLPTLFPSDMLWFSPGGNYLIYFDSEHGCHYFSYDLGTGKRVKISAGVPDWKLGDEGYYSSRAYKPGRNVGIAGWLEGDAGLLVYDNYDIWKLDLSGRKQAINITNYYGHKNKILLSLMKQDRFQASNFVFGEKDTLLLTAFNMVNKYNGFYRKILGLPGNPELLSMGPYLFQLLMPLDGFSFGKRPVCASKSNTWIVRRETSTETPNYFFTSDFKTYKSLTNLQSHEAYNWLTTELHSFKQLDGTISQGVLYKPENFVPSKKYPVIISFYWNMSSRLHQFPAPEYMTNASIFLSPAWMASHGYLVFLPDVYFAKGKYGPSTVNTIMGAANYLSQLPYVDSKKLAACGHSNSGRYGYYLLAHSNLFAAMAVGSGTTDMLTNGFSLWPVDGSSKLDWAEQDALGFGLGSSLWQNKNAWLDHSSVFLADKITTPLLIFQNKRDNAFINGIELFIALRRLEKPVWWLQYDNGEHTLSTLKDMKDYTIRYTQYFDHHLKKGPPPIWMTKGIPAKLKGIESGYELDPIGNCSDKCPICKAWNQQFQRTPEMFAKPISEWHLDKEIESKLDKEQELEHKKNMEKDRVMQKEAVGWLRAK